MQPQTPAIAHAINDDIILCFTLSLPDNSVDLFRRCLKYLTHDRSCTLA